MGNTLPVIDSRNKARTIEYSKQGWMLKSTNVLGFVSESKYNFESDREKSISPIDGALTLPGTFTMTTVVWLAHLVR